MAPVTVGIIFLVYLAIKEVLENIRLAEENPKRCLVFLFLGGVFLM